MELKDIGRDLVGADAGWCRLRAAACCVRGRVVRLRSKPPCRQAASCWYLVRAIADGVGAIGRGGEQGRGRVASSSARGYGVSSHMLCLGAWRQVWSTRTNHT
jgi:hypothetical protein